MTEPILKLCSSGNKPIDCSLCLICQKNVNSDDIVQNPSSQCISNIAELCKDHVKFNTNKYVYLSSKINKTDLSNCTYHRSCYSAFTRDKCYIDRKRKKDSVQNDLQSPSTAKRRLSRSLLSMYNKDLCIFCQEDRIGQTAHECMQDSRDLELKEALAECPETLDFVR